jgi:hypothetical protein
MKNYSDIVKSLVKQAGEWDDSPPAKRNSEWGNAAPSGTGAAVSTRSVVEMQQALADLAQVIHANIKQTEDATQRQSHVANAAAFNNFLVKRFTNSANLRANDPNPDQDSFKNRQLVEFLNSFVRTGGKVDVLKADGKWGPRTNRALWSAIAYSNAILQLKAGMKLQSQREFTDTDRESLSKLAYQNDKELASATGADKAERAKQIKPLIVKLQAFCWDVLNRVMNDSVWSQYIKGAPHTFFDPAQKDRFATSQSDEAEYKDTVVPDSQNRGAKVYSLPVKLQGRSGSGLTELHLTSLHDAKAFQSQVMAPLGLNSANKADVKFALTQIMNSLGMSPGMSSATPSETSTTVSGGKEVPAKPGQAPTQQSGAGQNAQSQR